MASAQDGAQTLQVHPLPQRASIGNRSDSNNKDVSSVVGQSSENLVPAARTATAIYGPGKAAAREATFGSYLFNSWRVKGIFEIVNFTLILIATVRIYHLTDQGWVFVLPVAEVVEISIQLVLQHRLFIKVLKTYTPTPTLDIATRRLHSYTLHFAVEMLMVVVIFAAFRGSNERSILLSAPTLLLFDGFSSLAYILAHRRVLHVVQRQPIPLSDDLNTALAFDKRLNSIYIKLVYLAYFILALLLAVILVFVILFWVIAKLYFACCGEFLTRHKYLCCCFYYPYRLADLIVSGIWRFPQTVTDQLMKRYFGIEDMPDAFALESVSSLTSTQHLAQDHSSEQSHNAPDKLESGLA